MLAEPTLVSMSLEKEPQGGVWALPCGVGKVATGWEAEAGCSWGWTLSPAWGAGLARRELQQHLLVLEVFLYDHL